MRESRMNISSKRMKRLESNINYINKEIYEIERKEEAYRTSSILEKFLSRIIRRNRIKVCISSRSIR